MHIKLGRGPCGFLLGRLSDLAFDGRGDFRRLDSTLIELPIAGDSLMIVIVDHRRVNQRCFRLLVLGNDLVILVFVFVHVEMAVERRSLLLLADNLVAHEMGGR